MCAYSLSDSFLQIAMTDPLRARNMTSFDDPRSQRTDIAHGSVGMERGERGCHSDMRCTAMIEALSTEISVAAQIPAMWTSDRERCLQDEVTSGTPAPDTHP